MKITDIKVGDKFHTRSCDYPYLWRCIWIDGDAMFVLQYHYQHTRHIMSSPRWSIRQLQHLVIHEGWPIQEAIHLHYYKLKSGNICQYYCLPNASVGRMFDIKNGSLICETNKNGVVMYDNYRIVEEVETPSNAS